MKPTATRMAPPIIIQCGYSQSKSKCSIWPLLPLSLFPFAFSRTPQVGWQIAPFFRIDIPRCRHQSWARRDRRRRLVADGPASLAQVDEYLRSRGANQSHIQNQLQRVTEHLKPWLMD